MQEKALSLLLEYQSSVVKGYISLLSQSHPCTITDILSLPFPKSLNFIIKKQLFLIFKKRIETGSNQEADCHLISETFSLKEWNGIESVIQKISFEERFVKTLLQKALQDYVQFLIAPRSYWVHHLFGSEPFLNLEKTVKVEKVKTLLVSLNEYPYLSNVFFQYIERKQLSEITALRFDKIIGDIDRKVISTFNSEDFKTLLSPFLIGASEDEKQIPTELFRLFFYEKELSRETELFQNKLNQGIFELSLAEAIDVLTGNELQTSSQVRANVIQPLNQAILSEPIKEESSNIQFSKIENEKKLVENSIQDLVTRQEEIRKEIENRNEIVEDEEESSKGTNTFESAGNYEAEKDETTASKKIDTASSNVIRGETLSPSEPLEQLFQSNDVQNHTVGIANAESTIISPEELQAPFDKTSVAGDANSNELRVQNKENEKVTGTPKQYEGSAQDDYPPFDVSPEAPSQAKSFEELLKAIREKSEKIQEKREQEKNASGDSLQLIDSKMSDSSLKEIHSEKPSNDVQPTVVKSQEENRDELEILKTPAIEPISKTVYDAEVKSINIEPSSPETRLSSHRFEDLKTDSSSGEKGKRNESDFIEKQPARPTEKFEFEPVKPLVAHERKVSIETLFSMDEKKRIIKKVFKGNGEDFNLAISKLDSFRTWREASIFIDQEVFTRFKVDEYSEEAVLFTESVFSHFYTK